MIDISKKKLNDKDTLDILCFRWNYNQSTEDTSGGCNTKERRISIKNDTKHKTSNTNYYDLGFQLTRKSFF